MTESQPGWYGDLREPWGARWVRCALQVNPYPYVVRHRTPAVGDEASPIGTIDSVVLLESCRNWKAGCIAAHATYDDGVLKKLTGQPRIRVWIEERLEGGRDAFLERQRKYRLGD